MKAQRLLFPVAMATAICLFGCGKLKDALNETSNGLSLPGHWLVTESDHSGKIERAVEKDSMVLTFKDDKAAFSPTDSVKGEAVYALISKCEAGPRPYKLEKNDLVLPATSDCPEKRVTIQQVNSTTLKFPDPENPDITRTFVRIDDAKYQALVKASERRP